MTLTKSDLHRIVPSAFQTEAHSSRSGIYTPIETERVIDALRDTGLVPVRAKETTLRRNPLTFAANPREGFQKHRITFRRERDAQLDILTQEVGEIHLDNAFDGSSAYRLSAGLFRLACLNGIVASSEVCSATRIRHTGFDGDYQPFVDGAKQAGEGINKLLGIAAEWKGLEVPKEWRERFALRVHQFRYPLEDADPLDWDHTAPVEPLDFVRFRRSADQPNDLWTVHNRAQEALIQGQRGVNYAQRATAKSEGRRYVKARAIQGIEQQTALNASLWDLSTTVAGCLN